MQRKRLIPRRNFLRRGAAALGALAAPQVIAAHVLGADGATPPSERITMGFIGLGHQGSGHLAGGGWTYLPGGYLGRPDAQVLAVCDLQPSRMEGAKGAVEHRYAERIKAGSYRGCAAYRDFRELLARADIDAVLIATRPNHLHAMMTIMAAKAGKDVYCEKPTSVTVREGQAAVEAVQRYGRVFQAGTQQRSEYEGRYRRAVELVRNGALGELKSAYTTIGGTGFHWGVGFGSPIPDGSDRDLLLGPSAGSYPEGGNWEQHHYDIVQWALDADRSGPVEIFRDQGPITYRYANGVLVYGGPPPDLQVKFSGAAVFVGTLGRIIVGREGLVADPPGILDTPIGPDGKRVYYSDSHSGNFLQCVRTRQATICDVETAHRAMSVILLGGIGQQLGRRLQWNPAKEQFIGDDEANRMLSLVARPPWRI
ncbi:MAG: Gfo/Idh/MocA family oxidoreductase [Thermoguttaceae bacterium]